MREKIISAISTVEPAEAGSNLRPNLRAMVARKSRNSGFTMLEVAIIISIVMILLAFGIPSMMSTIDTYNLNAAATSASWAIQTTRYQALMKGYPYQLTFSTATNSYQITSEPPSAGTFSNVGGAVPISSHPVVLSAGVQLQFKGNGSVSSVVAGSQTFTITYKGRTKTITVSNYGSVTVQ